VGASGEGAEATTPSSATWALATPAQQHAAKKANVAAISMRIGASGVPVLVGVLPPGSLAGQEV
jgi:hypothetical protein